MFKPTQAVCYNLDLRECVVCRADMSPAPVPQPEKPYKCPTCHITFSAKQALDQHELIHKGSKPLPCEFPGCDKTFRQQSARSE